MLEARPRPLLGVRSQPRADRVVHNIVEHRQEMPVLLDGKVFEAALPDMAMAVVMPVIPAHMTGQPPQHDATEGASARRFQHEMKMIGHQTEAKDFDRIFGFGDDQQVEQGAVVAIFIKDRRATVATIDDVVDITSDLLSPREARHDVYETPPRGERFKSRMSPFSGLFLAWDV